LFARLPPLEIMKTLRKILIGLVVLFVVIQLVPYGRAHTNPAVTGTPKWDSARTQELFKRACADCHSNETVWPWYSNIAPVSWMVQKHVDDGRRQFNVSVWGTAGTNREARSAANNVRQGSMPEPTYLPAHPEARLTDAEKQDLINGLVATFGDEQRRAPGQRP
jgi:mono/diheme cytochrome c family protein